MKLINRCRTEMIGDRFLFPYSNWVLMVSLRQIGEPKLITQKRILRNEQSINLFTIYHLLKLPFIIPVKFQIASLCGIVKSLIIFAITPNVLWPSVKQEVDLFYHLDILSIQLLIYRTISRWEKHMKNMQNINFFFY